MIMKETYLNDQIGVHDYGDDDDLNGNYVGYYNNDCGDEYNDDDNDG